MWETGEREGETIDNDCSGVNGRVHAGHKSPTASFLVAPKFGHKAGDALAGKRPHGAGRGKKGVADKDNLFAGSGKIGNQNIVKRNQRPNTARKSQKNNEGRQAVGSCRRAARHGRRQTRSGGLTTRLR